MPNLNGTGPEGKGKKTGRGIGNCEGSNANNSRPQRFNCRGRRQRFWRNDSTNEEINSLKEMVSMLISKLDKFDN